MDEYRFYLEIRKHLTIKRASSEEEWNKQRPKNQNYRRKRRIVYIPRTCSGAIEKTQMRNAQAENMS